MSISSLRLPTPLPPFHGESLMGYLSRVTEINLLSSTEELFSILDVVSTTHMDRVFEILDNIDRVSYILSLDRDNLAAMLPFRSEESDKTFNWFGIELDERYIVRKNRRVSPSSLANSPHHRFVWQLHDVPYCADSWELLIDRCPEPRCRMPLSWNAPAGVHICERCGYDLRHSRGETVAVDDRPLLRLLADIVSTNDIERERGKMQLHPSVRHLNPGVLLQLVNLFGRSASLQLRENIARYRRCLNYPSLQLRGIEILKNYPSSIKDISARENTPLLPLFLTRVRALSKSGFSDATREFVAGMIAEMHPKAVSGVRGIAKLRQDQKLLTLKEASRVLRLEAMNTRRLIDLGHLRTTYIKGDQRRIEWFEPQHVEDLAHDMRDRINIEEVNWRYGLPWVAIEQLVDLKCLDWHPSPAVGLVYVGANLRRTDFMKFRAKLEEVLIHDPNPAADRIRLSEVFPLVGPAPKPWGPILALALDGKLPGGLGHVRPDLGLWAYNLTVDATLAHLIRDGREPWRPINEPDRHYCTSFEVEEMLSCNPRDVALMLSLDVFKRLVPNKPKLCRQSVIQASRLLISSREIGSRIGLYPNQVPKWARRLNLKRPPGMPLWLRQDVEPFLPQILYGQHGESSEVAEREPENFEKRTQRRSA